MRKSPFSTPRGNGHPPNFGWKSSGNSSRGYARVNNFGVYSPNNSDNASSRSFGEDFIPLSPCQDSPKNRQSGGNWSSPGANWQSPGRGNHRNWTSPVGGFDNYRNNSPRDNNRGSPRYKNGGNSYRGNHKNFQRGNGRGKADLSRYVNLKWFLEDPWAQLTERLTERVNASAAGARDDGAASSLDLDDSTTNGTSFACREAVRASPVYLPDPKKSRRSQD